MDLTPFQWFQVSVSIGAVLWAVWIFVWGRERATAISSAVNDERLVQIVGRLDALEQRQRETPTLTEDRLQRELRELTHHARDLIVADLTTLMARMEKKVDEANEKSSRTWSHVQSKIGDLEVAVAVMRTRQDAK